MALGAEQQWMQDWLIREAGTSVNAENGRRRYPRSVRAESMLPKALGTEAERHRAAADAARQRGHVRSALKLYELALRAFMEAQHNLYRDVPLKRLLMERATDCFDQIIALAPQRIERMGVPFDGDHLPAVYHARDDAAPLLLYIPGMDGTKETSSIGPLATPFVSRGFRVFAFDGPGIGAARTLRGITLQPGGYARAISAALDFLQASGRWDGRQVWVLGSSMGTRWGLEAAAADSRISGLATVHAAFGNQQQLFRYAPPRFRKVLGFMTGRYDDVSLDAFIQETELPADLEVRCPTFLGIGEYDPLTSVTEARALYARSLKGPRALYVFGDAFHGGDSLEALCGLNDSEVATDWLWDLAQGNTPESGELYLGTDSPAGIYTPRPLEIWHTELTETTSGIETVSSR